ncbi:MAG: BamA/TamA family outer membrane protein [Flavobacteriales bacterium]
MVGLFLIAGNIRAQKDSTNHHFRLKGFPIVYYTPETRWAGGAAGVATFYGQYPTDTLYPSSVGISFIYTQEKQVLAYFPYNLYFNHGKYWLYGELGYYQYNYYFYGTGNQVDPDFREYYSASFARIRLTALQRIKDKYTYAGIKYAFDDIKTSNLDSTGLLYDGSITGSLGGRVSGIGFVVNRDTRNHKFFPTKGTMAEFFVYGEDNFTGSTFKYLRFTLDATGYFSIKNKHVFATHVNAVYINGAPPFTHMGMLGGYRRLRGYYEGRYRDNCMLLAQAEYRWMFWWRLGVVAFGGMGAVAHTPDKFALNNIRFSGGGGLRFMLDKKQRINLRIEYAFGKNSSGAYLTIGEAF